MLNLGTKKHKDKYYDGIDNLEYPGCFAMTELHHGKALVIVFDLFVPCFCVLAATKMKSLLLLCP